MFLGKKTVASDGRVKLEEIERGGGAGGAGGGPPPITKATMVVGKR